MEYTKDVIFSFRNTNKIGMFKIKREGFFSKINEIIKENKFIIAILVSMIIFIAIDITLVNAFLNLLMTL